MMQTIGVPRKKWKKNIEKSNISQFGGSSLSLFPQILYEITMVATDESIFGWCFQAYLIPTLDGEI